MCLLALAEMPSSEISRGGGSNLDEWMSIHFVLDKYNLGLLSVIQLLQRWSVLIKGWT